MYRLWTRQVSSPQAGQEALGLVVAMPRVSVVPSKSERTRRLPAGARRSWDRSKEGLQSDVAQRNRRTDRITYLRSWIIRSAEEPRLRAHFHSSCPGWFCRFVLAISLGQLRDYDARRGRPFAHDAYLAELTGLRDQLKAGQSQATSPATSAGQALPGTPPVAELADRIKSLKAAHTIDAAPERTAPRRIAAEEPVTARIRRRAESIQAIEPPAEPEPVATPVEMPSAEAAAPARPEEPAPKAVVIPMIEIPSTPARMEPAYRQQVARRGRQNDRQMSLF